MKKIIIVLLVVVVLAVIGALWWAQPLLALRTLKQALETRDQEAVATMVDFPSLRGNVVTQTDQKIDKANDDKFLGGLRSSVEKGLADSKIESLATPEGLIHLACDQTPDGGVDTSPQPRSKPCVVKGDVKDPHYLSKSRFKVTIARDQGGDMGITFGREDGSWKLVNLTGSGPASK